MMEIALAVIPSATEIGNSHSGDEPIVFRNYYRCEDDGTEWSDDWSSKCNDRCPTCDTELSPYYSQEIDNSRVIAYLDAFGG